MKTKTRIHDLTLIALFAALLAISAQIRLPVGQISFTMQTFVVFFSVYFLGIKRGTLAVLIYLLLGAVGLPVFSGFVGGIGILLGATGGYLIGFLPAAIIAGLFTRKKCAVPLMVCGAIIGLAVLYFFGTVWYMMIYLQQGSEKAVLSVLSVCVFPFILPDAVKIAATILLSKRLMPLFSKRNP